MAAVTPAAATAIVATTTAHATTTVAPATPTAAAPTAAAVPRNPWDPPEDLKTLKIGVITRAKNNAMFTHAVGTILDSGRNAPITLLLEQEHCTSIHYIVSLSRNDIRTTQFTNSKGDLELLA